MHDWRPTRKEGLIVPNAASRELQVDAREGVADQSTHQHLIVPSQTYATLSHDLPTSRWLCALGKPQSQEQSMTLEVRQVTT